MSLSLPFIKQFLEQRKPICRVAQPCNYNGTWLGACLKFLISPLSIHALLNGESWSRQYRYGNTKAQVESSFRPIIGSNQVLFWRYANLWTCEMSTQNAPDFENHMVVGNPRNPRRRTVQKEVKNLLHFQFTLYFSHWDFDNLSMIIDNVSPYLFALGKNSAFSWLCDTICSAAMDLDKQILWQLNHDNHCTLFKVLTVQWILLVYIKHLKLFFIGKHARRFYGKTLECSRIMSS